MLKPLIFRDLFFILYEILYTKKDIGFPNDEAGLRRGWYVELILSELDFMIRIGIYMKDAEWISF